MAANHDALFKSTFSQVEHAAGMLKLALPENVATKVRWSTLRLASGEFVDQHLSERKTDLLFEVELEGAKAYLSILFEHQSTAEPMMALRLFTYVGRIWDRWRLANPKEKRAPLVLPIVLYHGRTRWNAPTSLADVLQVSDPDALGASMPRFGYALLDLRSQPETALRDQALTALGQLVLLIWWAGAQGHEITQDLRRWMDLARAVFAAPHGAQALGMVLRYVLEQTDASPEVVETLVVEELGDPAREVLVTAAQRIREAAAVEANARLVAKLLKLRFGELPESVVEQLRDASVEQLDAWAERVLTAPSLQAVFE